MALRGNLWGRGRHCRVAVYFFSVSSALANVVIGLALIHCRELEGRGDSDSVWLQIVSGLILVQRIKLLAPTCFVRGTTKTTNH